MFIIILTTVSREKIMNLDLKTVLAEETGGFSHFLREGCDKGMKMQP
jgi:hypothetical protein